MGITKEDGKYNLCLLIDMEAQATTLESNGVEEGYDTAEGNDVPLEVVLIKKKVSFISKAWKNMIVWKLRKMKTKILLKIIKKALVIYYMVYISSII